MVQVTLAEPQQKQKARVCFLCSRHCTSPCLGLGNLYTVRACSCRQPLPMGDSSGGDHCAKTGSSQHPAAPSAAPQQRWGRGTISPLLTVGQSYLRSAPVGTGGHPYNSSGGSTILPQVVRTITPGIGGGGASTRQHTTTCA